MISFGILTSTPLVVRTFFIARNVMKLEDGQLVGVRPGTEWIELVGAIPASGTGTEADPYLYGTRRLFIVKFAHAALQDEIEGEPQTDAEGNPLLIWDRTKLGKWIRDNSTAFSIIDAMGRNFRGRKINSQDVHLIREDDMAQLHAWQ